MLRAALGYKIKFTFDMPDGSKNGGFCSSPDALPRVFEIVRDLKGANLVIEDQTIYFQLH